jgi:hypothetical protein
MINAVFKKFSELANKVEAEVEGLIEFDEIDYDAEISRLEERLKEVRDAKNKNQLSTKDPRTDLRKQVASSGKTLKSLESREETYEDSSPVNSEEGETLAVPLDIDREIDSDSYVEEPDLDEEDFDNSESDEVEEPALPPPVAEKAPVQGRASVFDRAKGIVSPPSKPLSEPSPDPAPSADRQDSSELPSRFDEVSDSMINTNDPDEMNRAIEEENRRLLQRRAKLAPHFAAKQVSESLNAEKAVLSGQKDGMEVYRMPTQTMSDRKTAPTVSAASKAPKPTNNPKFRPVR